MTPAGAAVIGAGRAGKTVARALAVAGHPVAVLSRRLQALPAPLDATLTQWGPAISTVSVVILAVPDDRISEVAERLAHLGVITQRHTVLHLSGLLDRSALAALEPTGAGLGSLHPLQTFLGDDAPAMLRSVPAVLEGDIRAVSVGRDLAMSMGMVPIAVETGQKVRYHAAAVFASNYLVALTAVAERLARQAGLGEGRGLFLPLMRQTLINLTAETPAEALTGPIRRGDVGTVRAHLDALTGPERTLYLALGREALALAKPNLAAGQVAELARLLEG